MHLGICSAATALLLSPLAPLAAQAPSPAPVTLGEWIARDQGVAMRAPGPERDAQNAALGEPIITALRAARAAAEAKQAAGAKPDACFPPPGQAQVTSREIAAWLYARPASERGELLDTVIARYAAERFPCR
jgi:hypothetical protein